MHAEAQSLIAGDCHRTPLSGPTDSRHRLSPQLRVVPLLHRGIEGIEIHMDNPTLPLRYAGLFTRG